MPNYDEYGSLWEGRSPNVTEAYKALSDAGMAPDNSWLGRLFGGRSGKITSQSLPEPYGPPGPPSPFSPQPQQAAPKPSTKISSGQDIATRIGKMILGANEPLPVSPADFGLPPSEYQRPQADPLAAQVNANVAEPPPPPRIPVDMRRSQQANAGGGALEAIAAAVAKLLGGGNTFGGQTFGGNTFGGNRYGGNTYGGNTFGGYRRAEGGEIPGFMRGGYPELYNAPVRHFDSGGQSYVDGYGDSDGRADDVSARLSPKEYVVDAETMSMLGDGNPDAGAKRMDEFRANVRKHKGRNLAKGKFSPNAKNPMEYLVGNPMGDGIRRHGKGK